VQIQRTSRRTLIKTGLLLAAGRAMGGFAAGSVLAERKAHTLIIVLDAFRADCIGRKVRGTQVTPHLNALAHECMSFQSAFSASSFTKESMASIFSGTYPPYHGVEQGYQAPPSIPTFFTDAKADGYSTAFFNTNPWLEREMVGPDGKGKLTWGFGAGVDFYTTVQNRTDDAGGEKDCPYASAADVNGAILALLSKTQGDFRPFFALAHYMDVHEPFLREAPDKFTGLFHAPTVLRTVGAQHTFSRDRGTVKRVCVDRVPLTDEDLSTMVAVKDEAAARLDEQLGMLFFELKKRGLYERMTIVVTADHGEELGEHGAFGHARTLHTESLAVPLMIKSPDLKPSKVSRRVSNVNLRRCLMELRGRKWVADGPLEDSLLDRKEKHDAEVYAGLGLFDLTKLVTCDGRAVISQPGATMEFDVDTDPSEKHPLKVDKDHALNLSRLTEYFRSSARKDRVVQRESTFAWQWVYREGELKKRFETNPASLSDPLRATLKQKAKTGESIIDDGTAKELRALGYLH